MPSSSGSPSYSSSAGHAATDFDPNLNGGAASATTTNAMQSWWESISKARARIQALAALLPSPDLASLADSDRPARSLLDPPAAYCAVSVALSRPSSGSGDDPLCQWLYDTFLSSDPELRLVALSFLPLLAGLYLSRVVAVSSDDPPSLAGFEAVLLAIYSAEVKARAGKPLLVSIPDLSVSSLYHSPRPPTTTAHSRHGSANAASASASPKPPSVGVLSPPLEPHVAVKSTKRACIVGVALDAYYKKIALLPGRSKIDFCEFVAAWAGQDCPCRFELDNEEEKNPNPSSFHSSSVSSSTSSQIRNFKEEDGGIGVAVEEFRTLEISENQNSLSRCNGDEEGGRGSRRGSRVPLPWELLQPVLMILGHCLLAPLNSQEVRDAASVGVRCLYARASHDLLPQAILATRSLIQLDNSSKKAAKSLIGTPRMVSNPNTPSKPRKPEVLLASK